MLIAATTEKIASLAIVYFIVCAVWISQMRLSEHIVGRRKSSCRVYQTREIWEATTVSPIELHPLGANIQKAFRIGKPLTTPRHVVVGM